MNELFSSANNVKLVASKVALLLGTSDGGGAEGANDSTIPLEAANSTGLGEAANPTGVDEAANPTGVVDEAASSAEDVLETGNSAILVRRSFATKERAEGADRTKMVNARAFCSKK